MVIRYLVTIKNNANKYTTPQDLQTQYNRATKLYPDAEWSSIRGIELDTLMRLHLHTIVYFKNTISMQRYIEMFNTGSWIIHFKHYPKDDDLRVRDYVVKSGHWYNADERSYQYHMIKKMPRLI